MTGRAGKIRIPPNAELLRTNEVAALFGVSVLTVRKWVKAGKFTPCRTLGGQHRIRRTEVAAQLGVADPPRK